MGIAKLIVLGASLGAGVVGLDRALMVIGTGGLGPVGQPVVTVAEPAAAQPDMTVACAPLVQRVAAPPRPEQFMVLNQVPQLSTGAFPHRYAVGTIEGTRVVHLECRGRPVPIEDVDARVREALESFERARGL
jgi:hypothetical protein